MKILEYDEVDPIQVLHINMLALDFPFTPELSAHIRRTDPRPFTCFTVNAVDDHIVMGQVGVFRLPMISTDGREEVGGVWAVSTPLATTSASGGIFDKSVSKSFNFMFGILLYQEFEA